MDVKKVFEQYLNFVKKYIPEPKVFSSIGLDIGSNICKLVEIKPKGNSFELVRWVIEPLNKDAPADKLKELLFQDAANDHYPPATAVHGKGTLIRYVDVPRMSADELKKSFKYEADKYLPFTADQIYIDYMILDPKGKSNKMSVMVAASKREIIDARMEILQNIGVQADIITLNPLAMANMLGKLELFGQAAEDAVDNAEALAIVDIGEKVTNVNIIYGGLPRFTRDIFVAGCDFTDRVSKTMGISLPEAERLKREPGSKQEEVFAACESVAMNLISDLRLSFDYFVTEHNIPIKKIILAGGSSLLPGLVELFEKYLEIEICCLNAFDYIDVPDDKKEELKKVEQQLGVALGLALYS